ncbi:hypothetical protein BCV71DRAFT_236812 [Rhizopus microsporus]|uniref:Uncharacterized protein n=1 Tax=Rhizopus microsporus TaxID=58291 RepID=A0A1X0RW54_RHIZD|nr:hypothetical protein BCV71DRAFT_236812 [Rhizopus microsporus]
MSEPPVTFGLEIKSYHFCIPLEPYLRLLCNSTCNAPFHTDNLTNSYHNQLHVDRLIYLLFQVVILDYWQDTIKAVHDFDGFHLIVNEEKKKKAAHNIDYGVACFMVQLLKENIYQCRSFTEDILFYKVNTKEDFLKNGSCSDQTKMYKHFFLVSHVIISAIFFLYSYPCCSERKRLYVPNEDIESADQSVRILLAKCNEKIKQLKCNPKGLDNLITNRFQIIAHVATVYYYKVGGALSYGPVLLACINCCNLCEKVMAQTPFTLSKVRISCMNYMFISFFFLFDIVFMGLSDFSLGFDM